VPLCDEVRMAFYLCGLTPQTPNFSLTTRKTTERTLSKILSYYSSKLSRSSKQGKSENLPLPRGPKGYMMTKCNPRWDPGKEKGG